MEASIEYRPVTVGWVVLKLVEWSGAGFGLLGAYLLAMNNDASKYGFVLYAMSNGCWLYYAVRTQTWSLFVMQVGFSVTSIIGIHQWFAR